MSSRVTHIKASIKRLAILVLALISVLICSCSQKDTSRFKDLKHNGKTIQYASEITLEEAKYSLKSEINLKLTVLALDMDGKWRAVYSEELDSPNKKNRISIYPGNIEKAPYGYQMSGFLIGFQVGKEDKKEALLPFRFEKPEYITYKSRFFDELHFLDEDHILLGYYLIINDIRSEEAITNGIDIRNRSFEWDDSYYHSPETIVNSQELIVIVLEVY